MIIMLFMTEYIISIIYKNEKIIIFQQMRKVWDKDL